MKKRIVFLSMLAFSILMAGCNHGVSSSSDLEHKDSTKRILVEKSESLFNSLKNHDWEEISKEVHPDGLVFTLFANLGDPNEVLLSAEELLTDSEEEIVWGKDLRDKEIKATKNGFVDNFLFKTSYGDDINYDTVNYNESSAPSGGVINNLPSDFPDSKYVEYYSPASEKEYDWQALRFVYQEHDGEWLLFAIVRDVYNP